ncbi:cytochrome P450 [Xylariaceae sp. FL0594]|nr:cytochrome P450 [Xylariaceae sp. FL0594]
MPWDTSAVTRNNATMKEILLAQISSKAQGSVGDGRKETNVDVMASSHDDGPSYSPLNPSSEVADVLVANLKMFLFAGHDTTPSTLCFMIKLLQDNPSCLTKLREEHDAVLGTDPEKAASVLIESPHLLSSLPYTLGVIKETLRLYPQAGTMRESPAGFLLSGDKGTQYPVEGFDLWLSAHTIHRNPHYWTRPEEFLPERWTVRKDDPLYPPQHNAFLPFSIGPRNCIGMELAMTEMKLVLVLMVRTFEIREAWKEWDELQ